jgi:hypothetical protein
MARLEMTDLPQRTTTPAHNALSLRLGTRSPHRRAPGARGARPASQFRPPIAPSGRSTHSRKDLPRRQNRRPAIRSRRKEWPHGSLRLRRDSARAGLEGCCAA